MVVRTSVEIKSDERKQQVERELSNFIRRENEFMAGERQERAVQLGLALHSLRRDTSNRPGPQGALSDQGQTLKDGYALARWPQPEQLDKLDIMHGGLFDNPRDIL